VADETPLTSTSVETPTSPSSKGQPISFFATIVTSIIVSLTICSLLLIYYHQQYAPKIMFFNMTAYNDRITEQLESGDLVREDIGLIMARLEERISELPPGTVVFREEVILSDVPEIKSK